MIGILAREYAYHCDADGSFDWFQGKEPNDYQGKLICEWGGDDVQHDRELAKNYAAYMLEQITHERNQRDAGDDIAVFQP